MGNAKSIAYHGALLALCKRIVWRLLSVPIFIKILGIGFIIVIIFSGITLLHTTNALSHSLYEFLEQRARASVLSLATHLERSIVTGDMLTVQQKLEKAMQTIPDARYVIVRDSTRQALAHTFHKEIPLDLERLSPRDAPQECKVQVFDSNDGKIFEARCPILDGNAGFAQLGITDRAITQEIAELTHSVLWALAFSMILGTILTLILTYLLTHPIHHLVKATNHIREGNFDARSAVFSSDEVGRLASSFNQMASSLKTYRVKVEETERARQALLDKIIQTQEEERKSIARELHDELGQSLAALLLTIQSNEITADAKTTIIQRVRALGDKAHRLAWGMHPSILDDYGLNFALSRYLEEISKQLGFEIDYQYTYASSTDFNRLPNRVEVSLYRITQEAVNNIVRHAHATEVSVVVLRQYDQIMLLVEDNGCGFNVAQTRNDNCLGLIGMRERALLLGGIYTVQSAPGKGTIIRVIIPLQKEEICQSVS